MHLYAVDIEGKPSFYVIAGNAEHAVQKAMKISHNLYIEIHVKKVMEDRG